MGRSAGLCFSRFCIEPEKVRNESGKIGAEALSLECRALGARVSSWRHVGDGNGNLAGIKPGCGIGKPKLVLWQKWQQSARVLESCWAVIAVRPYGAFTIRALIRIVMYAILSRRFQKQRSSRRARF